MSRTLSAALDKAASDRYLDSLTACRFCDWYFADPENRKTFRRTATTKRYNLVLGIVCHETKDVCGGCLTLALVVKYCWFPWYEAGVNMPEALRIGYLAAIEHNVADPERYGH